MAAELKQKGDAALGKQEYDAAIEAYTQAIALDGKNHILFSNRSAAYLSKGDGELALDDAVKCIEINSTWPKGYTRKGAALHKLQEYDDAISAYEVKIYILFKIMFIF